MLERHAKNVQISQDKAGVSVLVLPAYQGIVCTFFKTNSLLLIHFSVKLKRGHVHGLCIECNPPVDKHLICKATAAISLCALCDGPGLCSACHTNISDVHTVCIKCEEKKQNQ